MFESCSSDMAGGPVDHSEVLKGVEALLGKDGELSSLEDVQKVFGLMKASTETISRCTYLNILLQTKSQDLLNRFIRVGGYRLLNSWLTDAKSSNTTPLLQLILLTLQKLPVKVDHLRQNNTAKLVKQLSKRAETEDLRKLASVLVDGWMAIIRSHRVSASGGSPADKEKKKEEHKVQLQDVKEKTGDEEKKKEKAKAGAASRGLQTQTSSPAPAKKTPTAPQLGDNIKPPVLKRPSSAPSDAPHAEKKHKPLNPPSNAAKEPEVKMVPAQPEKPNVVAEPRGEEETLKKGKKKKRVHWAEEEQLQHFFCFDLDETERVNVNKLKRFGELMEDRETFETACGLYHDNMEEQILWTSPRPLTLAEGLVTLGINSTETLTQRDREMDILQEICLSKESVPDCPHEPDPEPYEPMAPRLIPLDEDLSMVEDSYVEDTVPKQSSATAPNEGSKLGVQELLSSLMAAQGNQPTEDLGSFQQSQDQNLNGPPPGNPGLLGRGPGMNNMNGDPPNNAPGGPRFNRPPPPHNHGPHFSAGGPRMMGPPPSQGRGGDRNSWGDEAMRGGWGPAGWGRGGRGPGGDQGFRGRGAPRGGLNNMNDMSNRPVCRHFKMKGSCRYGNNCAFYHPGVNGPRLPPIHRRFL